MHCFIRSLVLIVLLQTFIHKPSGAQLNPEFSSAEIYREIEALGVLGSVMYVAAHPDDENTRMISYLSNSLHIRTAYLSMTRGDGGQNLIGPEISEQLGLIRTQELLEARKTDGGEQWFTRANDFGYSKSPEETLEFWGKEEILSDVVWAIRNFKPDVIITRFSHEHFQGNHGHHTGSAILAYEAFDLSGDPGAFPEQLKYVDTWQPKHLFFNTSWWFYGSRENFEKQAELDNLLKVEMGDYDPVSGYSDSEIAAMSRSMHKSQGFGMSSTRGKADEYLQYIKGESSPDEIEGLFDDVAMDWTRIEGGKQIQDKIQGLLSSFDFRSPDQSIDALFSLREAISNLPENQWKQRKLNAVNNIIRQCLGLYVEASTGDPVYAPGDSIISDLEVTLRRGEGLRLTGIQLPFGGGAIDEKISLKPNVSYTRKLRLKVPQDTEFSDPYWLREPWGAGRYTVEDFNLRGKPETAEPVVASLTFSLDGRPLTIDLPLHFKTTDPVKGEITSPLEILPPVFLSLNKKALLFNSEEGQSVTVHIKSNKNELAGKLHLQAGEGWKVDPAEVSLDALSKGDERNFIFTVTPPRGQSEEVLTPVFTTASGEAYSRSLTQIKYDHIEPQSLLLSAEARLMKIDLQRKGNLIAYVQGAGDDVPQSLEQMGYRVDILTPELLTASNLAKYDAVLLGIRAFNTIDELAYRTESLFSYVENGGTLIAQYNTRHNLVTENIGPLPLKLSRDRVTDETSEVHILLPDHPVIQGPNKIGPADFEGWVQERGLYFPDEWDPAFEAILGMHDKGEDELKGSLLVAKFGKGYYVYTPLAWFRQLPAGVPGAYRLMANLIALGQDDKS